jgi:predicted DNA-binding protein (MmcQ/YjbR family)
MPTREDAAVLRQLRTICLELPGASETTTFGHPAFQVAGRPFAVLERYRERLCIVFKAEMLHQQALVEDDTRFWVAPYVGRQGWVSMLADVKLDWREVRKLIVESQRLVRDETTSPRRRIPARGRVAPKRTRPQRRRGG